MSNYKIKLESHPFSWNDKMAQLAIEDFDSIRDLFPYCQTQSIGLALAKLKMIEDGELNLQNDENIEKYILHEIKQLEKSYRDNGFCFERDTLQITGYTRADIEYAKSKAIVEVLEIIKKYLSCENRVEITRSSRDNDNWVPVEDGFPKDDGVYDVTVIDGAGKRCLVTWQFLSGKYLSGDQTYVDGKHYWADNYKGDPINKNLSKNVIAWRYRPEPYKPDTESK